MTRLLSLDEKPVLDLTVTAFEHLSGSILVLGTWYMDKATRTSQPCLVLLDAARKVRRKRTIPCVILLEDMWKWTLEMGDPDHITRNIHDWLSTGALPGSPTNKADVFRVMDAVQSRLRDLVMMPPLPVLAAIKNGAVPVGDLTITERNTGNVLDQIEVMSAHVRH